MRLWLLHAALQVQYVVDMAFQRHVVCLGCTEKQTYPAGMSSMHFAVSDINVSGLKRIALNNVGLLLVRV